MNTLNFEELCAQTVEDRKGHIAELETSLKSNTLSKREAWYVFQLEITASKLIQLDIVSTGLSLAFENSDSASKKNARIARGFRAQYLEIASVDTGSVDKDGKTFGNFINAIYVPTNELLTEMVEYANKQKSNLGGSSVVTKILKGGAKAKAEVEEVSTAKDSTK